jgi:hypothetical protein
MGMQFEMQETVLPTISTQGYYAILALVIFLSVMGFVLDYILGKKP